ncbi:hypothetical protein FXF69_24815 [Actinomadura chibensis]|uniref:Uncharacterized protein n=1 Tax=Actinomadura chibensis TaxID=392828 RepID=A0A5D0NID5_9ACTN|nr:hypothetical protein FXF69_24815 [Actinomadura chibensis]
MESGSGRAVAPASRVTGDDRRRIGEVCDYLRSRSDSAAVADVLPVNAPVEMVEAVTGNCAVDHVGCLVFSSDIRVVRSHLEELGLRPGRPSSGGLVRDRLAARYRVPEMRLRSGCLDVRAILAQFPDDTSRGVELFCVDPGDELDALALRDERAAQHENHLAVRLTDPALLEDVRDALGRPGGPRADGGGYDPSHGDGGATVLHFRADGRTEMGWPRRLEVIAPGRHTDILLRHLAAETAPREADEEDRRLLRRLTGAWATQALRAMAELDLSDHLADRPLTCAELADLTGVDADRLHRLLRALCHPWIGALAPSGRAAFALTDLGRRLARGAPNSMHHLALMYGDLFYTSFGALTEGIRDGAQPFTSVYGQPPFDYLTDHPHQRRLFTRAMAEGSAFFADVATVVDLSGAAIVADIGGGNGELLAQLCDTHPHLKCALLERPEVIGAARENLEARGHLDRCTFFPGSFTDSAHMPVGADVYVVARILHDWDDRTCLSILRAIRAAATTESTLLVIERPLSDDPSDPCVSALWDLNMLVNNVGGRERTRDEYRRLLGRAGFTVIGERPLRLDISVTVARVHETPETAPSPAD